MAYERFYNLVLIIFNQTFGIKKNKNEERFGASPKLFPTYQLGRDLRAIQAGKKLNDVSIYIGAINDFFELPHEECIEKTTQLIERLFSEGYLTDIGQADILNKCDKNTLELYKNLLIDIWTYYYGQYTSTSDKQIYQGVYSIPQETIKNIISKYTEFHLPVSLDFYKNRVHDILDLLKTNDPHSSYLSIEAEYIYFFKNVLENDLFYTLSRDDKVIFFNTLYTISDILDKTHHKDSFKINLELLAFFNQIYADNYYNIELDDIRKIQGCIYAIAIDTTAESTQGVMKLTPNNNLTRKTDSIKPISQADKYEMCIQALTNLLNHKNLHTINKVFEDEGFLETYERRLKRNGNFRSEDAKQLYVLSLIYSNIAATHLQYIKHNLGTAHELNEHIHICTDFHERSRYIRKLLIYINKAMYGPESPEYEEAIDFLANFYHSLATRYYYQKKYAYSIAIRSVLYNYFLSLGAKEKANMQLQLSPIAAYEQNNGTAQLYETSVKTLLSSYKKDFAYLSTTEMIHYDEFKDLVNQYLKYKDMFYPFKSK